MLDELKGRIGRAQQHIEATEKSLQQLTDAPHRAQYLRNEIAKQLEEFRSTLTDEDRQQIRERLAALSPTKGTLSAVVNMPREEWQEYQFLLKLY